MYKIISVNYPISSDKVKNIDFEGSESLLDADIIIIDPLPLAEIFLDKAYIRSYDKKKMLYKSNGSLHIQSLFQKRNEEIRILLENGKVIISFLSPSIVIDIESDEKKWISNYDFNDYFSVEFIIYLKPGEGRTFILDNPKNPFSQYFKAFNKNLKSSAYFVYKKDTKKFDFFLLNKAEKTVGFTAKLLNGLFAFLPYPIKPDPDKLIGVLEQCVNPFFKKNVGSSPPPWINDFKVPGEDEIKEKIAEIDKNIDILKTNKRTDQEELDSLLEFKSLLYEQGIPLENAAIKSFELLGFKTGKRNTGDVEHDIILNCPEGKAIVEVEGKDTKAINIDKFDQLTRVVDEDFDITNIYAEGILLGNPFRKIEPKERVENFTNKAKKSS